MAAPETGAAPYDATAWSTALGYPGAGYLQHLGAFLRGLEWWTLTPHADWLRVDGAAAAGVVPGTRLAAPYRMGTTMARPAPMQA